MTAPGTILVVDDQPENLRVLVDLLGMEGHRVLAARDGRSALQRLEHGQPELVLLDVMMPGMDGYEVCRRIRAHEVHRHVPVVFMSALTDAAARVRGLEAGAADFVSKPVRQEELLARVRTQLELGRLHRGLEQANRQLRAFAHTVAHDLKGPLALVQMSLDRLDDDQLDERGRRGLDRARRGAQESVGTVDALLLLAEACHGEVEVSPVSMHALVTEVLEGAVGARVAETGAWLTVDPMPDALGYGPWLRQVWINLLDNACKYAGKEPRVRLSGEPAGPGRNRYAVQDSGPGLAPGQAERLFLPFERRHEGPVEGLGLGLTIVSEVVRRLGGDLGVEDSPEGGARFWFELPSPG